jgi:hypothetical protein
MRSMSEEARSKWARNTKHSDKDANPECESDHCINDRTLQPSCGTPSNQHNANRYGIQDKLTDKRLRALVPHERKATS